MLLSQQSWDEAVHKVASFELSGKIWPESLTKRSSVHPCVPVVRLTVSRRSRVWILQGLGISLWSLHLFHVVTPVASTIYCKLGWFSSQCPWLRRWLRSGSSPAPLGLGETQRTSHNCMTCDMNENVSPSDMLRRRCKIRVTAEWQHQRWKAPTLNLKEQTNLISNELEVHFALAKGDGVIEVIWMWMLNPIYVYLERERAGYEGHRVDLCSSYLGRSQLSQRARNPEAKSFKCNEKDGWAVGRVLRLN